MRRQHRERQGQRAWPLSVLQPRLRILDHLAVVIDRFTDLLEEGDEGGDAEDLGTDEQRLDPGGGDLHRAHAVQDPDDELHILQSEAEVIGGQLLVQVNDVDPRLVAKEVFEILARGGEHDLVGPEDLALADQGDVHMLASAEILAQGGEHGVPLLRLKAADDVTGRVDHLTVTEGVGHCSLTWQLLPGSLWVLQTKDSLPCLLFSPL